METNISNNETMAVNGTVEYESMTTLTLFERFIDAYGSDKIQEILPYRFPIFAPGDDWEFALLSAASEVYPKLTEKDKTVIKGYFGVVSETTINFNEDDECFESETKNIYTLYVSLKQVEDFIKLDEEGSDEYED